MDGFDLVELLYEGDSDYKPDQLEAQILEPTPSVQIPQITAPEPLPTEIIARPIISRFRQTKRRDLRVQRSTSEKKSTSRRSNQPGADLADYRTWEVVDMSETLKRIVAKQSLSERLRLRPTPAQNKDGTARSLIGSTYPPHTSNREARAWFTKASPQKVIIVDDGTMTNEEEFVRDVTERMTVAAARHRHQVYLVVVKNDRIKGIRERAKQYFRAR